MMKPRSAPTVQFGTAPDERASRSARRVAFVVARARSAAPVSFGRVCNAEHQLDVVKSLRERGDS